MQLHYNKPFTPAHPARPTAEAAPHTQPTGAQAVGGKQLRSTMICTFWGGRGGGCRGWLGCGGGSGLRVGLVVLAAVVARAPVPALLALCKRPQGVRATAGQHAALVQGRHSMMQSAREPAPSSNFRAPVTSYRVKHACIYMHNVVGHRSRTWAGIAAPRPARHKPNKEGGVQTCACLAVVVAVAAMLRAGCKTGTRHLRLISADQTTRHQSWHALSSTHTMQHGVSAEAAQTQASGRTHVCTSCGWRASRSPSRILQAAVEAVRPGRVLMKVAIQPLRLPAR